MALDQPSAFNLICIAKGDEWKTAIRTRFGLYEMTVIPFRLTNALATEQELINDTLREYLNIFVLVYIDDTLVFTKGTLA